MQHPIDSGSGPSATSNSCNHPWKHHQSGTTASISGGILSCMSGPLATGQYAQEHRQSASNMHANSAVDPPFTDIFNDSKVSASEQSTPTPWETWLDKTQTNWQQPALPKHNAHNTVQLSYEGLYIQAQGDSLTALPDTNTQGPSKQSPMPTPEDQRDSSPTATQLPSLWEYEGNHQPHLYQRSQSTRPQTTGHRMPCSTASYMLPYPGTMSGRIQKTGHTTRTARLPPRFSVRPEDDGREGRSPSSTVPVPQVDPRSRGWSAPQGHSWQLPSEISHDLPIQSPSQSMNTASSARRTVRPHQRIRVAFNHCRKCHIRCLPVVGKFCVPLVRTLSWMIFASFTGLGRDLLWIPHISCRQGDMDIPSHRQLYIRHKHGMTTATHTFTLKETKLLRTIVISNTPVKSALLVGGRTKFQAIFHCSPQVGNTPPLSIPLLHPGK